jgi:plasmid stabilization system protein ParE
MKPVEFHPDAADDAREAATYYEGIRADLAADFQTELGAALGRIRDNPLLYAAESGTIRVCPVHRFPYSVFYEDLADRVWVAAVGHHRRRPGYWARRRPS